MKKLLARFAALCAVSSAGLFSANASPPTLAITAPTNSEVVTSFVQVSGWVTNDVALLGVKFTIREFASGVANRWWNGTSWQAAAFALNTTITGTNWTNSAGVALPPVNSGVSYEIKATATDVLLSSNSVSVTVQVPIEDLVWDPGTTHLGTQVKNAPHNLGGPFIYKIVTQGTTVGGWRTALNVAGGEADIYLAINGIPNPSSYNYASANSGSDGFVLNQNQFAESQEWYYLVNAQAGSTWNLVSGEPYVLDLGALPDAAASGTTNVAIGAEGWRFFRTVPPAPTLAWRLWLNGASNSILVRKDFIPTIANSLFDFNQSGAMLLVPDYLQDNQTYFVGVPGTPGQALKFQSKQQPITDVAFNSGQSGIGVNDYPYRTYRVPVPIDQIAWQVKTIPSAGNADLAIRRTKVPNEFNNDAYSEVSGTVQDSVTLVPPTLSDGTFFITVYGATNRTYTLTNGEPFIPIRAYALTNVNDQPTLVGWRYYVVSDIPSQLGTLGWELMLSGQPPGTEIALRRNAVPGRWNSRVNGFSGTQGYVDYSDTDGLMQRPGHQADIWYIGIYQPNVNLGSFTLNTHAIAPPLVPFNNFLTNVAALPLHKWQFLRIDVPADIQGWDLRVTSYANGYPQFAVRRDLLPQDLGGFLYYLHDWTSGAQEGSGGDWTTYPLNPDGSSPSMASFGLSNPIVAGTYYIGVRDDNGPGPMSYSLLSRGIGTNYAIGVSNLNFTGAGSAVTNNVGLPVREAAYYRLVIPPNQPNWKLRLTPISGDAMLIVQRDFLPNAYAGHSARRGDGYGVKLQKLGREHYLALPVDGEELLPAETNYVVVVSEGVGPNPNTGTVGTGVTTYTLESLGPIPVASLGTLGTVPGSSLSQSVSLEGGEVKLFQFTVASNTAALEVRLTNRVGNPSFTVRFGTNASYPHVPSFNGDYYGADWGYFQNRQEDFSLVTIANPVPGVYTLTMKGEDDSGVYPDASANLVVIARGATPLAFNNGSSNVTAQPSREWRYFRIDVPTNALGWDVRVKGATGGYPVMIVRRDLLPEAGLQELGVYGNSVEWPSGGQLSAPIADWTDRARNADLTESYYKALVMGTSNFLTPGTYFVAVYNNPAVDGDTSYTLESRGIGAGFALGITNLNFSGAGGKFTNSTGLAPREADYFRLVIPPNARSWKLRATPTDGGELTLIAHHDDVPNIFTHPTAREDFIGRKLHKVGKENFLLLPDEGQSFLTPRTNYLAVISEGHDPIDYQTLGTNSVSYILESLGEAPNFDLGLVPNVGVGIISNHVSLDGGETKLFHFALSNAVDSLEIRLENRIGNPSFVMNGGTNPPYSGIPFGPSFSDDAYGIDGGWISSRVGDYELISLPNPTQGVYSVSIKADDGNNGYPDAEADFTVTPIGSGNVAFDGGTAIVSGHAPNTWRYFTIEVPADPLGWDVRVSNVTGDVGLRIRRDDLPDFGAPGVSPIGSDWPSGQQFNGGNDWVEYYEANGSVAFAHVITVGWGNPLTNGTYRIGIYHGDDAFNASYTLTSRGIGAGYSIPVNSVGFNGGTASHPGLAPREVAYYAIEVPSNAPSWKLKLDTSAGGESRLVIHKDHLPNVVNAQYNNRADYIGKVLAKDGDEHYVLLPDDGKTNIAAGIYYVAVASEGVNPANSRVGTGTSAFTLHSLGVLPVTHLGTVPALGSRISQPVVLAGGEVKAFDYEVPPSVQWLEFRLANRQGNPGFALRHGPELPYPQVPACCFNFYGDDGGYFNGRIDGYTFQTYVRPAAGTWALTVKAEYVGNEYPGATNTVEVEQRTPSVLVFSNGMVSTSLGDNQRIFYQVTVPTNVLGWKLDLIASNGVPQVRARKDLLPSDAEPAMQFGGPSVVIAPPFLEPGTWFVEVKGSGPTTFKLTSNPVLLQRPAWTMQTFGGTVTTPGLPPGGPLFADTGVDTNGVAAPGDQGTDLGAGDFHYYVINVPNGNGGLLRAELLAISGNPDMFVRRGGLPTFAHNEFGPFGNSLVDFQLTGTGTEYANWVPLDGRTETQLGTGLWYLGVRANGSNARYRMRLGVGAVTNLASGTTLSGQTIAGNDWRYYRIVLPTNAPESMTVTYSQQQGDTEMYVRDTIPPGEPYDTYPNYRRWTRDNKNGGPYFDFPNVGTYTLTTPTLRPGHVYYLGFRAVSDASFTVSLNFSTQTIDVTNVIAFYGGTSTVTIPAFGVAKFRVPVPADATSWRHSNTHSGVVELYLDQGTLPDLSRFYRIWENFGSPDSQLIQFLNGWPWVANQNYYFLATNTSASPQSLTIRMDGRNAASDDSDFDGLPDGWEILYFGNLNQNGLGDPDGDGINNATEFAEGTNPANPASLRPRLTTSVVGNGHIVIEPNLPSYTAGQSVTLTAVADPDNIFAGWSGDTTNATSNPLTITMNSNKTITATFSGTSTPLLLESAHVLGNGHLQFTVTGPAAATLIIDAVNGLGSPWVPIETNSPFQGTFIFEDQNTGSFSNRFYRGRIP